MHESKKNVGASNKQKSINEGGFASIRTKNLGNQWAPPGPLGSSGPSMYALRPRSEVDICHIAGCK